MKAHAYIFLIVFISFINTSSILAIVDEEANYSSAFSLNEEENNLEINYFFKFTSTFDAYSIVSSFDDKEGLFFDNYMQDYHKVHIDITSPPPRYF
ncbi:hypothetical protein [Zunongwangia sp. HRR-M8]|uniref:hypothetical protein n=1 Tax=Zunongwangia sp. HRR-M8 TaxID=3015170 RepID=UPI0022DE40E8|nr:hypothetical protein [Zunongwangia sp. HRR-M8]WBL22187.1 hypothetical protein PBT89_15925 [Zunongwangia sp. HRR-M8]